MKNFSYMLFLLVPFFIQANENVEQPNVVIVLTDDQGYGDIGIHGNRIIKTPNLDAMHSRSLRLTNFHTDPTCAPSRAAIMTGRYSTRTGAWHTLAGRSLLNPDELTIAESFKQNGYGTAMFGKWHLGDNYPLRPEDQGFEHVIRLGGGGVEQTPDYWGNDNFDDIYWLNSKPTKFKGYATDTFFDQAMDYMAIQQQKKKPFFVYLATNAPHSPLNVESRYSDPYRAEGVGKRMAQFYGMITNIDENVGRLISYLKKSKAYNNTIFIFMSDNGTSAGFTEESDSKWHGFNDNMRGTKGSNYEGGHRVPLFIEWPKGGLNHGRDINRLTAHIDLLPTLLALTNSTKPDGFALDGIDLSPLLLDEKYKLPERTLFVHSQKKETPTKYGKFSVMTDKWRMTKANELFDISADPSQKNNVANAYPEVMTTLHKAYDQWWQSLVPSIETLLVHISLGSPNAPVVRLTAHDWHSTGKPPWNQKSVKQNNVVNGKWSVNIEQAGTYQFSLYQWDKPANKVIDARKAFVQVGEQVIEKVIADDSTSVTLIMDLPAGKTTLSAWFEQLSNLPKNKAKKKKISNKRKRKKEKHAETIPQRGASYVYATKIN